MGNPRVLVAGHLTHDRHAGGFTPGGCAFYAAEVYRRLGAQVHMTVTVGEDFEFDDRLPGDSSCTVTRSGRTTVFANIYPRAAHEPRIQLIESVAPPVLPEHVPRHALRADIVHLAPVMGELEIAAWSRAVDTRILAINVQGWVRRVGSAVDADALAARAGRDVAAWARGNHVIGAPWDIAAADLAGVRVAFLSREDLEGQDQLLERLLRNVPIVALTAGAHGCDVVEYRGGPDVAGAQPGTYHGVRLRAFPTEEVEATGAGDTFAAGFLYQLANGASVVDAARFGAAAASISVEGVGDRALDRMHEAAARVARVELAHTYTGSAHRMDELLARMLAP